MAAAKKGIALATLALLAGCFDGFDDPAPHNWFSAIKAAQKAEQHLILENEKLIKRIERLRARIEAERRAMREKGQEI